MHASVGKAVAALLCLVAGAAGCSDLGEPMAPLYATTDAENLFLTNTSGETLYYFIVPTQMIPVIDWITNSDPEASNRVLPHSTKSIPLQDFFWVRDGKRYTDLTVYWWSLVRTTEGTYEAGPIESFRTMLN